MLIYPLHIAISATEPEDKKLFWMHSNPLNGDYRIEWYSADGWRPIWVGSGGDVEEAPLNEFQYTRGQGMWNKLDLSGISDSIDQLQQELTLLQEELQNEIERSIGVEGTLFDYLNDLDVRLTDEITRAIEASQANADKIDNINTKINDNFVVGVIYNPTNTGVERVTTRKNIYTGVESTTSEAMPIVSNTTAGIVLPDLFNTVNTNTDRITTLEQTPSGARRLGIFDNKSVKEQTTNTTLDEFVIPADAKEHDTAIVRRDENHQFYKTEYELDTNLQWVYLFIIDSTPPIATNTTTGVVKGDTADGKVAIETDGSMSVVGWDGLKDSIPTNVSELVNDAGYVTVTDIGIDLPDATSTIKGVATLGSTGGAARYGHKEDVGLSNVDNTSDLNKPISNATQTALSNKLDKFTTPNILYGVGPTASQVMYSVSTSASINSVPRRTTSGDIAVNPTVSGNNAIGATQVDLKISTALADYTYVETDPVFNEWKNDNTVILGLDATTGSAIDRANIAIGNKSNTSSGINSIAIGNTAISGANATAIGNTAIALGANSIAIGNSARIADSTLGSGSIQLGHGTNTTPTTFQVGAHRLLDLVTGKIPQERLLVWYGTQTEYDAIVTKDPEIEYNIYED